MLCLLAMPARQAVAAPAKTKVALLTYGLVTGDPWNAVAYDGLKRSEKELGAQIALSDNLTPDGFEAAFRDYGSQGYNLVIGHSFGFGDSAKVVTRDFPNVFFAVITGAVADSHLASFNLQDQENGYLTGALAAMVTKTNVLGILGGADYPSVDKEINGFIDGAKSVKPDIKILVGFVGSWDDSSKARELAQAMIEQKADVLSAKTGGAGMGVLKAAEAGGVWGINDVATAMQTFPKACLTSTDLKFDNVVYGMVKLYQTNQLEGKIYKWGISSGAVDIGPINKAVPKATVEKIMALRKQIVSGALVIPEKWQKTW
jgi:basic membrane protein A